MTAKKQDAPEGEMMDTAAAKEAAAKEAAAKEAAAKEAAAKEAAAKEAAAKEAAAKEAAAKEAAAKEPTVVVTMLRGYFPTPEERGDDERRKWPKGEEITLAKSVANSLKERYLAEITRV